MIQYLHSCWRVTKRVVLSFHHTPDNFLNNLDAAPAQKLVLRVLLTKHWSIGGLSGISPHTNSEKFKLIGMHI